MTRDVVNFNAGPAGLPEEALVRAKEELLDFEGTGMSIMEHSHRGASYEKVHNEASALVKELLGVPDTHQVLWLQGGASTLFAMVPMNFLKAGTSADYVHTGEWSKKAIEEAKIIGKATECGTGLVDGKFVRIPEAKDLKLDPTASYLHITTNNTIEGTQYKSYPTPAGKVPLVADMSSDILSRPIEVSRFSMIYAGAQKNIGPSGVVLVIVDKAWMQQGRTDIPKIFRFKTHGDNNSLYNTPPTFSVYLARNVLAHVKKIGGVAAVEKTNAEKAKLVYDAIDNSRGFYRSPVEKASRSVMNLVWRLPSEELESKFVKESEKAKMVGLKGHRSVGGIRASLYNAVTVEGARRLATFMADFAQKNG
jgi:phosphoserine aminotransferase